MILYLPIALGMSNKGEFGFYIEFLTVLLEQPPSKFFPLSISTAMGMPYRVIICFLIQTFTLVMPFRG